MTPDWARLGISGNPFINIAPGTHLSWVDVPAQLEAALRVRPFCVELVGPKGAGKSTLLRALAARWPESHYHYAAAGTPLEAASLPASGVWCLDEANNLRPRNLAKLGEAARERGVSLLVATHWSLSKQLGGVWHSIELERVSTLAWVQRRVEDVACRGSMPFDFAAVAPHIQRRVGGVNYAVLRVLYELAENLARGVEATEVQLERAFQSAAQDETIAPYLQP